MNFSVSAILLYSIVGGVVLVYFPFFIVAYGRLSTGYDMSAPRASFDKLPAYAQRATWAHQNCFEALIIFSAAALMAYVTGVESFWAETCAIAFLGSRFLYSIFYISNIPILRSLMFGIGSISSFTLFALSLLKVN